MAVAAVVLCLHLCTYTIFSIHALCARCILLSHRPWYTVGPIIQCSIVRSIYFVVEQFALTLKSHFYLIFTSLAMDTVRNLLFSRISLAGECSLFFRITSANYSDNCDELNRTKFVGISSLFFHMNYSN